MAAQNRSHNSPAAVVDDKAPLSDSDHNQEPTENFTYEDSDSDGSGISLDDLPEFITVNLSEIRKDVECPICLGIMRKTRTVMECLHRFCGECIDKAMRMGNNECPACRTHCASRRSLRNDPNYDALIAALFPDIDKYEAEELEFDEEEKAHNEQIQASIAETLHRQSEAKGRKCTKPKQCKRGGETQVSQSSLAPSSMEGVRGENEPEVTRELVGADVLIPQNELATDAPNSHAEVVVDAPISLATELAADAANFPDEFISTADLIADDVNVLRYLDLL